MRRKYILQYIVSCAMIIKFATLLCARYVNAESILPQNGVTKNFLEELAKLLAAGDKNEAQKLLDLHNAQVNASGFKCGFNRGYQTGTEQTALQAFFCAIMIIKTLLQGWSRNKEVHPNENNMSKWPQINKEIKAHCYKLSNTNFEHINNTRDDWICQSILEARTFKKIKPLPKRKQRLINQKKSASGKSNGQITSTLGKQNGLSKFFYEVDYTFGKCMYLLTSNAPQALFREIQSLLVVYHYEMSLDNMTALQINFCSSAARSFHLANAIAHGYVDLFIQYKPAGSKKEYFYDILLHYIPNWYLTVEDISFINIIRYADYSIFYQSTSGFRPMTYYPFTNPWKNGTGGDLVVFPTLYNTTECGYAPLSKASTIPPGPTFNLNRGKIPITVIHTVTIPPPTTHEYSIQWKDG